MSKATLVCVWLLGACATAGSGDGGAAQDAAVPRHDGAPFTPADAGTHDAAPVLDAQVSQLPPDASTGSGGLFCSTNSECTVAGECCVNLGGPGFCAPGTPIGSDVCLPD